MSIQGYIYAKHSYLGVSKKNRNRKTNRKTGKTEPKNRLTGLDFMKLSDRLTKPILFPGSRFGFDSGGKIFQLTAANRSEPILFFPMAANK